MIHKEYISRRNVTHRALERHRGPHNGRPRGTDPHRLPWFEARRGQYDDRLLGVSARDDWGSYLRFFAEGLRQAADTTRHEMVALVAVQTELKDVIRASPLRADSAHALVDLAVANPTFTVRKVEAELGISYGRANKLVGQLVELGILDVVDPDAYKRRFFAPRVLQVLSRST